MVVLCCRESGGRNKSCHRWVESGKGKGRKDGIKEVGRKVDIGR